MNARIIIYLVSIALGLTSSALEPGGEMAIDTFNKQLALAEPLLATSLSNLQSSYTAANDPSSMTCTELDLSDNTSTNPTDGSHPVAKIVAGYVQNTSSSGQGCYINKFQTVGNDNVGMFVVEVSFKTTDSTNSISPMLSGKSILFIATGQTSTGGDILLIQSAPGSSSNIKNTYSNITDFTCFLKTQRCGIGSGNSCGTSDLQNISSNSPRPGILTLDSQDLNLFKLTRSPSFFMCGSSTNEYNRICEIPNNDCS